MDAPNYISKLILNWFESVSFCFGMRANLPGVGSDQGLRGKGPGVQPVERQGLFPHDKLTLFLSQLNI